jgi:hypothetical protein
MKRLTRLPSATELSCTRATPALPADELGHRSLLVTTTTLVVGAVALAPAVRDKKRRSAIAKYDFPGEKPGDLAFEKGETIMLSRTNATPQRSWWKGKIKGNKKRAGVFPRDFVTEIGAGAQSHAVPVGESYYDDDSRSRRMPGVEARSSSPMARSCFSKPGVPEDYMRRGNPPPLPQQVRNATFCAIYI